MAYLQGIERILRPEGVYILITLGGPDDRVDYIDNPDPTQDGFLSWEVSVMTMMKPQGDPEAPPDLDEEDEVYYVYICRKDAELDGVKDEKRRQQLAEIMGETDVKRKEKELKKRRFKPKAG